MILLFVFGLLETLGFLKPVLCLREVLCVFVWIAFMPSSIKLSSVSPWVDPRETHGELFFVTNKNHSKPLGKGYKIEK